MKKAFAEAWPDYKLLLGFGLLYAIEASLQVIALNVRAGDILWWTVTGFADVAGLAALFIAFVGLCVLAFELFKMHPAKTSFGTELKAALSRFRGRAADYLTGRTFASGCLGLIVGFQTFFFTFNKATIRFYNPYWLDPLFAAWDKALHFGRYPDEWMRDFLGPIDVGPLLQVVYFGWFFVMYVVVGSCLFLDTNRRRRLRFIWVFALCWFLLGGLGASFLCSVGPIFFHDFYPQLADPYTGLRQSLAAQETSLHGISLVRQMLLDWAQGPKIVIPNAPSAMPSLHCGISWLLALYLLSIDRLLGILGCIFCLLICFACVYFGFHYAIDSYFSLIAVSLFWWAAGRHVRYRTRDAEAA